VEKIREYLQRLFDRAGVPQKADFLEEVAKDLWRIFRYTS
jgi:hypothetical protein